MCLPGGGVRVHQRRNRQGFLHLWRRSPPPPQVRPGGNQAWVRRRPGTHFGCLYIFIFYTWIFPFSLLQKMPFCHTMSSFVAQCPVLLNPGAAGHRQQADCHSGNPGWSSFIKLTFSFSQIIIYFQSNYHLVSIKLSSIFIKLSFVQIKLSSVQIDHINFHQVLNVIYNSTWVTSEKSGMATWCRFGRKRQAACFTRFSPHILLYVMKITNIISISKLLPTNRVYPHILFNSREWKDQ